VVEKAHQNVFEIIKNFKKEQASTQGSLLPVLLLHRNSVGPNHCWTQP